MSIQEEAKREAERRRPDIPADPPGTPGNEARFPTGYSYALERAMFVAGAVWAREQDTRESQITDEMVTRADLAIQGFWRESYPTGSLTTEIARAALEAALGKTRETEQDTREPSDRNVSGLAGGFQSEADSESALSMPSDAEVEAAARKVFETDAPSHEPEEWFTVSPQLRNDYRATARAALLAAQEVRRG